MVDVYYNDADDRPLVEHEDDMEIAYLENTLFINEDIILPVLIVNGVPYYD